jgi:hypothetical protein
VLSVEGDFLPSSFFEVSADGRSKECPNSADVGVISSRSISGGVTSTRKAGDCEGDGCASLGVGGVIVDCGEERWLDCLGDSLIRTGMMRLSSTSCCSIRESCSENSPAALVCASRVLSTNCNSLSIRSLHVSSLPSVSTSTSWSSEAKSVVVADA